MSFSKESDYVSTCSVDRLASMYPTNSLQAQNLQSTRVLCPWNFPDKNTGVGCHFLLQGISSTQGSDSHLLHCKQILSHCAIWEAQGKWLHIKTKIIKFYFKIFVHYIYTIHQGCICIVILYIFNNITLCIYMYEYYSFIRKKKSAISNNMNGLWGHYAKWNKSNRERQILYDIRYMWNP